MSRGPDFRALIAQHGSPLLLLDCAVVRRQYKSLQAALPGVGLFYALKPLPHPAVVAELRDSQGYVLMAGIGRSLFDYHSEQIRSHQDDWAPLLKWLKKLD